MVLSVFSFCSSTFAFSPHGQISHVGVPMPHCIWFCRTTTFWQGGGVSGRGSGLLGGSLLWPPISRDQPAEQPGGEGVVRWPLWGAQEEQFLHWGEKTACKDHVGVSGRWQNKENISHSESTYYHAWCRSCKYFLVLISVFFLTQSSGIWPLPGNQICYCETLWRGRSREHDGFFLWAFPPFGSQWSYWHCHRHAPQRTTQPPDRPAEVPTRGQTASNFRYTFRMSLLPLPQGWWVVKQRDILYVL